MKSFHFRLEALLTIKESKKEKALENYAFALQKRQTLQKSYEADQLSFEKLNTVISSSRQEPFTASYHLSFFQNYLRQKELLEKEKQDLVQASIEEKNRLNEFLEKKKEFDILDKLKSKRKQQHLADSLRLEEKQIEDIVNSRQSRLKHE